MVGNDGHMAECGMTPALLDLSTFMGNFWKLPNVWYDYDSIWEIVFCEGG